MPRLRLLSQYLGWFALFALLLFGIVNIHAIWAKVSLWLGGHNEAHVQAEQVREAIPPDDRIVIPALDLDAPMRFPGSYLEEDLLKELQRGVAYLPGTALPGATGTSFITGHSSQLLWEAGAYKSIFATIGSLATGDDIIVYRNGNAYVYIVTKQEIVSPNDTHVLSSQPQEKQLALLTCWPIGTIAKRLIVYAELDEQRSVIQIVDDEALEPSEPPPTTLPQIR